MKYVYTYISMLSVQRNTTGLFIYIFIICIIRITRGRLLNGELYAQRLQKLIYLPLSADCFTRIYHLSIFLIQRSSLADARTLLP